MSRKTLTIGLIGYQFMGKAHSNAYRQVNRFFETPYDLRMKTICGRTESAVSNAANQLGWEGIATDWRKVVDDPEIDIIDIATPGNTHAEIAIAATHAGKIVFCEKPLANTFEEATLMREAVRETGYPHLLFHNYRHCPSIVRAKQLIEDGKLGEIRQIRACYLQDWLSDKSAPYSWRLSQEVSGSGALGDLGSHIIDLARYLVGEFESVIGQTKTFQEKRIDAKGEEKLVDVDDLASFLATFESGQTGTFEVSRVATGRKNQNKIEIYGSQGSLVFDLEKMNELLYYEESSYAPLNGYKKIIVSDEHYWPPGHLIGYEHTFVSLIASAMSSIYEGKEINPNFECGWINQKVLHAVEESIDTRTWQKV